MPNKFEEKQYFGFNSYSLAFRMVLSVFCFVTFYYSENSFHDADLLFLLGIILLVLSIVLLFVRYITITVDDRALQLKGMWAYQLVRVEFSKIRRVEKTIYSRYHLNNSAFKVKTEKETRFYTNGNDAVRVWLDDGTELLIGSHKADELARCLQEALR